jgi:hypothetical protein
MVPNEVEPPSKELEKFSVCPEWNYEKIPPSA